MRLYWSVAAGGTGGSDATAERGRAGDALAQADPVERGRGVVPPVPPPDREVLTTRDLAGLLMVPVPTIQRLWRTTDFPGRPVGKELRFVRADILTWISAGHTRETGSGDDPEGETDN